MERHRLDCERPACHPFVIMQAALNGSYTEPHQPSAVQCLSAPCVVADHGESNDAISRDPLNHRRDPVAKKITSRSVASSLAIGAPFHQVKSSRRPALVYSLRTEALQAT